jgi:uncharacterized phage-associated protein
MKMIRFYFEESKALEAAAYLLQMAGGRLNVVNLMKLLYFAERESIRRWNHPVTGDQFRNMAKGPVLLKVTSLLQEHKPNSRRAWHKHIHRVKNDAVLASTPETRLLSRAEKQLFAEIWKKFGHLSFSQIVKAAHDLPEWEPVEEGQLRDLPPEKIYQAVGKSAEEISAAAAEGIDPKLAEQLRKIYASA